MTKKRDVVINVYGGVTQILPNVKEVEQHIHDEDGTTIVVNKFKV